MTIFDASSSSDSFSDSVAIGFTSGVGVDGVSLFLLFLLRFRDDIVFCSDSSIADDMDESCAVAGIISTLREKIL